MKQTTVGLMLVAPCAIVSITGIVLISMFAPMALVAIGAVLIGIAIIVAFALGMEILSE